MIILNIELIRYLAMLSMLIDHIGMIYNVELFRNIGRIAFPLFSYIFIRNLVDGEEKIYEKYLSRLLLFGLISQLPFSLLSNSLILNIMFQFLGFLLSYKNPDFLIKIIGILISIISDYSIFGWIYLSSLYLYFKLGKIVFGLVGGVVLMLSNILSFGSIMIGALIIPLLTYVILNLKIDKKGRNLPYYVFYGFYPAHLFLLYLISK